MTITYRNGFGDRLAFATYHLPRNPIFLLISVGMFLFFTFETVLPAARSLPGDRPMAVRIIAFIMVEVLLLLVLFVFWAVIIIVTMISKKNKPLYCQRNLTVGDEGFVSESEYGRSEVKWSMVQKLARTRKYLFLYLNAESAVVVPRSAFESAAQWDGFYEICQRGSRGGA